MSYKILILILFTSAVLFAQTPKGSVSGTVVDLETKLPLVGVNIFIKSTNVGTSTNQNGEFEITDLEVGTYTLVFSYIGYEKATKPDVIVRSQRTTSLEIELKSTFVEIETAVVTGGYFSEVDNKPVSTINFSSEEIRRAPGSAGDVSRIIYGLPSLAKVNDQRNSLIVRGGSPVENSFYIDNIEIPNINHFPVEGSSDGPIGILNVDFIDDVNFYSGGFSPVYGDRLSSIMEISYREGTQQKFAPQLNLSLAGFGAAVEGPLGDGNSYMFSFNKSYLDLILNENETGGAMPNYGDAQGKLTLKIDDKNKISFLDVMSIDQINLDYENALETDLTNVYGQTDGFTNTAGINWQYIWGETGYSNTSVSHTFTNYDRDYSETKSRNHLFTNKSKENLIRIRNVNYYKASKRNSFEFGAEGSVVLNQFDVLFEPWQDHYGNMTPEVRVDRKMDSYKAGLFAIHHWNISEKLTLDYGLRSDYFEFNSEITVSPRATLTYKLSDKTDITAGAGIFNQFIPNYMLVQNDAFKNLKTPASHRYILGLHHMLGETTRLSVEAYYKSYKNFPVDPTQPYEFLFDQSTIEGLFLGHDRLVDKGEAFSRGIEVMVQKKLASDFYGLVSASLSKSRYKDLFGTWHDRIYDNQFNFTVEGGYIPNNEWEFKIRWIYAGGAPYTPFDLEQSYQYNKGIWDLENVNSKRLPDYHSLNIRVDKRFYFSGSNLILYLSVWNAYGRENVAQYLWNEMENKPDKMLQWSTLPVLGVEYEF